MLHACLKVHRLSFWTPHDESVKYSFENDTFGNIVLTHIIISEETAVFIFFLIFSKEYFD